jgi:hypothetical protein
VAHAQCWNDECDFRDAYEEEITPTRFTVRPVRGLLYGDSGQFHRDRDQGARAAAFLATRAIGTPVGERGSMKRADLSANPTVQKLMIPIT